MERSLLILGRQPALGLAELESLFGAAALTPFGPNSVLLDRPAEQVPFERLGGVVKLCRVLRSVNSTDYGRLHAELSKVATGLSDLPTDGKLTFGLSAYGLIMTRDKLFASGLTLKKVLRTNQRSLRLVPLSEGLALTSAQVLHNGLTGPAGCELVLARGGGSVVIGRTIAEQDINTYSKRDRDRPKRDSRVGMLPPKLAQIIINLAAGPQPAEDSTALLDPFCGTGVVLQEARLMGFSVYGSDIEPRMIDYSQTNLDWLAQQFSLPAGTNRLETGDATTHTWRPIPGLVAGEGYLGAPLTRRPAEGDLAAIRSTCNLIAKKSLQNLARQLPAGTRLCLGLPAWQRRPGEFIRLPLLDQLSELGYNRVSFEHARESDLIYARADQIVARDLLVLIKN